ncbi:MAG: sugar ABC transporter ATP-binding protein [Planctomycetota bacterium]|jgi:ribose transport system ATP-binding protein|nr:sugar ABC transporter ATP-binding protein [Planctomycetota bacterium]
MRGIDKRFPGVHALKNCQLSLKRGEVLALVGENGAGKSTLMKILTGIYPEYAGEVWFDQGQVRFQHIREAQQAGISIVHQELNMLNNMTVAKNIFLGRESEGFFYSERRLNQLAQSLIDEFHIHVLPTDKIIDLSVGKMQMVEIARAMSFPQTKVLILDEPTAALSETETSDLFEKIRALRDKGVSIIFISHRMGEIKRISDRVTVMRDGEYIDTVVTQDTEIDSIIKMMVGRDIGQNIRKSASRIGSDAETILEVRHLSSPKVHDVSFSLRRGEILGFAGLVGAGRTEVMRLLFGADRLTGGEVLIRGKPVLLRKPQDAVAAGLGYLSEDRKRYGLVLGMSLVGNAVMASLNRFLSLGLFVNFAACLRATERFIQNLSIKTPGPLQLVKNLSGGNQQKVVVTKWLIRDTDILIFDEPTRGIDVGAKAEIYRLIEELTAEGKAIIMVSSELPEILRLSDRVVVMCEGRKTAEFDISEATAELIMKHATANTN